MSISCTSLLARLSRSSSVEGALLELTGGAASRQISRAPVALLAGAAMLAHAARAAARYCARGSAVPAGTFAVRPGGFKKRLLLQGLDGAAARALARLHGAAVFFAVRDAVPELVEAVRGHWLDGAVPCGELEEAACAAARRLIRLARALRA
jgi:hypothetical protein